MTYVFDMDGTLCHTVGENYAGAVPRKRVIARLNRLHARGVRIVIDTARGSGSGIDWTELTERQLQQWGVRYDALRCGVKIPADKYVDDRSEVW